MKSVFEFKRLILFLLIVINGHASFSQNEAAGFKVGRNVVTFNSDGLMLKGYLYLPKEFDANKKYTAIIFDGPMTGLKDQVAGLYAQKLSDSGFVTLSFDHSFYGESEGMPRQMETPNRKVEDNRNAVTYLLSIPFVNKDEIIGIGICAGGGYMAKTVALDKRIKKFVGVAGAYQDSSMYKAWFGGRNKLNAFIQHSVEARLKFEQTGEVEYIPAVWSEIENSPAAMRGFESTNEPFAYYGTSRGYSPYYMNRVAVQGFEDQFRFDAFNSAANITVPVLIVHGTQDVYCSPENAQHFYDAVTGKKEFCSIATTNHIDLYDQAVYVSQAVSKIVKWIKSN
jgi:fermentation-respiration switch protein FrsA (DUF1100 family)